MSDLPFVVLKVLVGFFSCSLLSVMVDLIVHKALMIAVFADGQRVNHEGDAIHRQTTRGVRQDLRLDAQIDGTHQGT